MPLMTRAKSCDVSESQDYGGDGEVMAIVMGTKTTRKMKVLLLGSVT
jgi:hypothetical protein